MSLSPRRCRILALVFLALASVASGCRAQEKKDCAATETVFHGGRESLCATPLRDAGPLTEAAAKQIRDEAARLDEDANKLRALPLQTRRLVQKRDRFVAWDTEEARLCRELLQTPPERRRSVEDALTAVAHDRRSWVEGLDGDCMQLLHPSHF